MSPLLTFACNKFELSFSWRTPTGGNLRAATADLCLVSFLYIYIYLFIKNWTLDITFLAFSLARRTQVTRSYTGTTKYGQWKRHEIKKAGWKFSFNTGSHEYRIYSCISRPFTTKKSAQKIALNLYTSHTQRPDETVREISITTAWRLVTIVVEFHQFSAHS